MSQLPPLFAALSDPTRFAIVERLLQSGPQSAGDLGGVADISAPAISRHLKTLRDAGVISQEVRGTQRIYRAEPEALRAIAAWTIDHRAFWEASLDRLARAFGQMGKEN